MKVNLTKAVIGLDGNPVKERGEVLMMNKVLANALVIQDSVDDPMHKYELATKLYEASGEIEIAESEKALIKKVCESGQLLVLIAAQILIIINNSKN
jgi:hypothetical protein